LSSVSVSINGKNYRMACDEGQESHLENLARHFDECVIELKGSFGEIGDQRLVVMAGITLIDEVLELRQKVGKLETDLATFKDSSAVSNRKKQDGDDELAKGIESVASKIEELSKKLNGSST